MDKKINLEEIFDEIFDGCCEEVFDSKYDTFLFAKTVCRQVLELAAEIVQQPYLEHGMTNLANRAKNAVLDTINQIEP